VHRRLIGESTRLGLATGLIPASELTRERLTALLEGKGERGDLRSELMRLAAIIEEGLEGEATDALGRDYYARGAAPGEG
jgi:hypothetical protein